jgi:predicted transcriptional regulator
VVQRLVVHLAQALGHRLDRLAAAVQQQSAQVALPAAALVGAWQRREDVLGEGLQASTDRGQLGRCEATHGLLPCAWTGRTGPLTPYPSTADLTESY